MHRSGQALGPKGPRDDKVDGIVRVGGGRARISKAVIPKPRAFTSGARDLARSGSVLFFHEMTYTPRQIPRSAGKAAALGMTP